MRQTARVGVALQCRPGGSPRRFRVRRSLPAPLGRLDAFASPPPTVTGFFLIDAAIAGEWETWRSAAKAPKSFET